MKCPGTRIERMAASVEEENLVQGERSYYRSPVYRSSKDAGKSSTRLDDVARNA